MYLVSMYNTHVMSMYYIVCAYLPQDVEVINGNCMLTGVCQGNVCMYIIYRLYGVGVYVMCIYG